MSARGNSSLRNLYGQSVHDFREATVTQAVWAKVEYSCDPTMPNPVGASQGIVRIQDTFHFEWSMLT
ncbi:hypothetical protein DACRYDRAFT_24877 [Dacryopinax primogenitus]|uniref:Uncharacterized protein n=1 Tax=Dacryopinax primogenitus (strain DJM 731) TaxID=1858805 RepID=M5FWY0_DACPD|nr:uncharacterized protein DACRYDRAFT_24877 [Dacryopinax primogenitus]EJT97966.1 hypothetical protein DACRYDRAFT_24877 [Dacryopinax primogenitus]